MEFDPLLYQYFEEKGESYQTGVISQEEFQAIAKKVRDILRDQEKGKLQEALISPEARNSLKDSIARIIISQDVKLKGMTQSRLIEKLQEELLFYGPIQKALDDPMVTNIDINRFDEVYLEREGNEEFHPELGFLSEDHLEIVINKMLMAGGKTLTANDPHIDSLFEKYRICAVLGIDKGGVSGSGTCCSIRKFSEKTMTPEDLISAGTISSEMNDFFKVCLPHANLIIAGATNSGKTTTLMALPAYFDKTTRIITIEDSPELMLTKRNGYKDYHNIVELQSKDNEEEDKAFDIARLTKVSLRMRPMKVIIGEVRDAKACKQAHECMNTGHTTYFTIHASSCVNAATRIVQLAGEGYNDETIAAQLAATVDLIIFQQKIGKRRIVTEVCELLDYEGAKRPVVNTLFCFSYDGKDMNGEVMGKHKRVGGISKELKDKLISSLEDKGEVEKWT